MINQILAEWTKLRTTASFWWTSGLAIVFGGFYGALLGWTAKMSNTPYLPITVIASVMLTTVVVIMVQQAMMVTTEYRFGIPATNFRIRPMRWQVGVAKLLLGAVLVAVVTLLTLVVAFVLGDIMAPVAADWIANPASRRALWALPLGMTLVTVFTQGIGWIVRNTAGTIVVALGMLLVVESVVGFIPRYGQDVVKFLPFNNLMAFMTNQPTQHWELSQSVAIFVVWAVVIWISGMVVLTRRDA